MIDKNNVYDPIKYMQLMGSISHTYGNALAFIQKWLTDLFPENLFRTYHINSKIAHRQLRSTKYEYLKKQKPMLVLRPRIEHDEDRFLSNTPMTEIQLLSYNNYGLENLLPFYEDKNHEVALKFQLNRTVMYVDVILVFSTLMQQLNYVNYIKNSVPVGIPFTLSTCFESYLSQELMQMISNISGVPLFDDDGYTKPFLDYMNQNSNSPVTFKLQGSTQTNEFYRYYPVNIDTKIDTINTDDGDRIGQVMDSYQISFSIRMEFFNPGFYYLFAKESWLKKFPKIDIQDNSVLIPVYTDVVMKEELELDAGWHMFNRVTCMLDKENDSINFESLLNPSVRSAIGYHLNNGIPLDELIKIKIRKQGHQINEGPDFKIDYKSKTIQFYNKEYGYYTYAIIICINLEYLNSMTVTLNNLK